MSIDSVATLVNMLRDLNLADSSRLAELTQKPGTMSVGPKELARELVKDGTLTSWQANRLFQGQTQQLVLGQYRLLEKLGEGGMGIVFKARHHLTDTMRQRP